MTVIFSFPFSPFLPPSFSFSLHPPLFFFLFTAYPCPVFAHCSWRVLPRHALPNWDPRYFTGLAWRCVLCGSRAGHSSLSPRWVWSTPLKATDSEVGGRGGLYCPLRIPSPTGCFTMRIFLVSPWWKNAVSIFAVLGHRLLSPFTFFTFLPGVGCFFSKHLSCRSEGGCGREESLLGKGM